MNFLDTYDIAGQTPPIQEPQQPQQSLNEEVSEVIGQLGRFWGGFRKQACLRIHNRSSQSVLQTARKDFGDVVSQAQKELTKLTTESTAGASTSTTSATETSSESDVPATHRATGDVAGDAQDDAPRAPTSAQEEEGALSVSTTASTSLFSRLQSALPPNLLETARNQLPESLKNASENIDLPQLRANFVSELQRVQGVTRAQAEEYVHKTDELLREAVKEAGEVLRDAVKILPPEETAQSGSGLVWDGSDMWSLPLEPSDAASSNNPPTSEAMAQRRYADAQDAVATRAESLFRRLKHDPDIVRHDPAVDGGELYSRWVADEVTAKEGGIEGEHWSGKISALLAEPSSGAVLKTTRDTLVPSELTEGEFWTRFFFRCHQIEAEEQKRKALLEGTREEEDFSWEDDDDETAPSEVPSSISASVVASSSAAIEPLTNEEVAQIADTSRTLSKTPSTTTRQSSEDFHVVSSGNASSKAKPKAVPLSDETQDYTSDADSDWE
ncbi:hypothetical protein DXG03_003168 [Asterophora parasitica]|uniref:BSD domain-containing protein n=1 Tax=Asterophora parasitica TaxID=117018 RepID=A0A9P7GDG8_9AGAR|nr:hypothetical protein DXG03_003168 [Asterophora parasitica]